MVGRQTRDRKVARTTPRQGAIKSTGSTQPSIPPGEVNRVPTCMAGVWRGAFTCVGWQVTLCDPIWRRPVDLRWASPRRSYIGLYKTYEYSYTYICIQQVAQNKSQWASRVLHLTRHITDHFGDESFQVITCDGTDNRKPTTENTPKHTNTPTNWPYVRKTHERHKNPKTKPKPACLITPVRTANLCVLMTAYNCGTQYSTKQFW